MAIPSIPTGVVRSFPSYYDQIEGFGSSFKREIKRRYPTPVSFIVQAPTLPSDKNLRGYRPGSERFVRHSKGPHPLPMGRITSCRCGSTAKQICADVLQCRRVESWNMPPMNPKCPATACTKPAPAAWETTPRSFVTNRFGRDPRCGESVRVRCQRLAELH